MVKRLQPWRLPGFGLGTALLLLFSALPASAQSGNLSDVTGAIVTTSDIAGGSYYPLEDGEAISGLAYADPAAEVAVNNALFNVTPQLQAILGLDSATDLDGPSAEQAQTLINNLANEANGVSISQAERLVLALVDIWQAQSVSPAQLLEATAAFNDIVSTADNGYILNPPTPFQQIRAVLNPLVIAAVGATS